MVTLSCSELRHLSKRSTFFPLHDSFRSLQISFNAATVYLGEHVTSMVSYCTPSSLSSSSAKGDSSSYSCADGTLSSSAFASSSSSMFCFSTSAITLVSSFPHLSSPSPDSNELLSLGGFLKLGLFGDGVPPSSTTPRATSVCGRFAGDATMISFADAGSGCSRHCIRQHTQRRH